jgi:hypothetical protein
MVAKFPGPFLKYRPALLPAPLRAFIDFIQSSADRP